MQVDLKAYNSLIGQLDGAYHDVFARMGISDSVFDILYVICEEGDGCRQSALYRNSGLRRSTVNSAIRKMERDGLLRLAQGEGRNTRVFLTDAGKALSKRTAERVIAAESEIFRRWTDGEREQFLALHRRYLEMFLQLTKGEDFCS